MVVGTCRSAVTDPIKKEPSGSDGTRTRALPRDPPTERVVTPVTDGHGSASIGTTARIGKYLMATPNAGASSCDEG